jgi:hypothetical protein
MWKLDTIKNEKNCSTNEEALKHAKCNFTHKKCQKIA